MIIKLTTLVSTLGTPPPEDELYCYFGNIITTITGINVKSRNHLLHLSQYIIHLLSLRRSIPTFKDFIHRHHSKTYGCLEQFSSTFNCFTNLARFYHFNNTPFLKLKKTVCSVISSSIRMGNSHIGYTSYQWVLGRTKVIR